MKKIISVIMSVIILFLQVIYSYAVATVVMVAGASAFAGLLLTIGVYFASQGTFDRVYQEACAIEATWRGTFQVVANGYAMVTAKQYDAMIQALKNLKLFYYTDMYLDQSLVYDVAPGQPATYTEYYESGTISSRFVPFGDQYTFEFKRGESLPSERITIMNISGVPVTIDVDKSYDYMYITSYDLTDNKSQLGRVEVAIDDGGSFVITGGELPFYKSGYYYRRRVGALVEVIYGTGAGVHQLFFDLDSSFKAPGLRKNIALKTFGNATFRFNEAEVVANPQFADFPRYRVPSLEEKDVMLVPPIPQQYIDKGKTTVLPVPSALPSYNPTTDLPSDVVKTLNPDCPWDFPFGKEGDTVAFPDVQSVDVPEDTPIDPPAEENPPLNPPLDLDWLKQLIQSILEWLRKIVDAIKAIPALLEKLVELITKFFDVSEFSLNFESFKLVNLQGKFPFCIPFDFLKVVKAFSAKAKEPDLHIKFDTPFLNVDYKVPIAPYKIPIAFFRSVVVIFFSYILITKTRDMIKW